MENISVSKLVTTNTQKVILKNIIAILLGSSFIALAAQITISLKPIPISLQNMAVLFTGMFFGPKKGAAIILTYLAEGCFGLPVFANFASGFPVLFGPTGGYLLGYIPATILIGYLLQQGGAKNYLSIFLSLLSGDIALFISGYFFLAKFVDWDNAYLFGVAPFYIIEVIKLSVLTIITPFFWQRDS